MATETEVEALPLDPGSTEFRAEMHHQMEAERQLEMREEEQQRQREFESEMQKRMVGAFDDLALDLYESDSDTEDNNKEHNKYNMVTSTPFVERQQRNMDAGDTNSPIVEHKEEQEGNNEHFSVAEDQEEGIASSRTYDQLQVLYLARGHEIERLKRELQSLQNESTSRHLRHELIVVKQEKNTLNVQLEQVQEVYDNLAEENRELREQIRAAKEAKNEHEAVKNELIGRCEESESLVQSLQQQLLELQRKDTVLKLKEHHEAVVSSLKQRYETEAQALQRQIDHLNSKVKKYEYDVDFLNTKISESARHQQLMLMEKDECIAELQSKLSETQQHLSSLISRSGKNDILQAVDISNKKDALEEILDMRTKLAQSAEERDHQRRTINDLNDELSNLKLELNERKVELSKKTQAELEDLKQELSSKSDLIELLHKNQKEFLLQNDQLKVGIARLQDQLHLSERNVKSKEIVDDSKARQLETLKAELKRKDEHLIGQEAKIRELVEQWQQETEKIKSSHCRDKSDLDELRKKYSSLKRKAKAFQKYVNDRDDHYKSEIQGLREEFAKVLLGYKHKMEEACTKHDKEVEREVLELREHIHSELSRAGLVGVDVLQGRLNDGNRDEQRAEAMDHVFNEATRRMQQHQGLKLVN